MGTDAVGALSASGTSAESIDLTAPSTAGRYYYGACVEAVSGESDTTNNCSAAVQVDVEEPVYPDLEVGTPSVNDGSPETRGSFTLSATVSNAGDGESPATTLHYYRSADATITTSDTQVGTGTVGVLFRFGNECGVDRSGGALNAWKVLLRGVRGCSGGRVRHHEQLLNIGTGGRRNTPTPADAS